MRGRSRIGLALAGGGPEGGVYEIGALRALEEALDGVDFNAMHVYVGVSAGSFVAASLANGLTPSQMCRALVAHVPGEHPLSPTVFFRPAAGEFLKRTLKAPRLFVESLIDYFRHPDDLTMLESLTRLGEALPVAVFDNDPIRAFLVGSFSRPGRTDDFRKLKRHLIVVAADLDSGQAVRFGEPGFDHVPISKAVQASTALPGIYPPVKIDDRNYLDGVLLKTLHASVALDNDADLLLAVNPIVPVDVSDEANGNDPLVERGLPSVLSQTFRTLIHSRLTTGFAAYATTYPDRDMILIEPQRSDTRMFFTNIFSFSTRKRVCEHAYHATLAELRRRRDELKPMLAKHGITLRDDVIDDEERDLWAGVGLPRDEPNRVATSDVGERLDAALNRLERLMGTGN